MFAAPHRWVELHLALKFLRPKRSYVSAITILSLLGVLVGVAVLIVVLSVMDGFERELRDKIVGFNAHVTVTNYALIKDYTETMAEIRKQPEVVAVTPFLLGPVLVEIGGRVSTPFIKGIDLESHEAVIPMKKYMVAGEWQLGPDSVIVGEEWARRNQAWVGDKILVYSPRNLSRMREPRKAGDESYFLPSEYTIRGLFSTGYFEYDFNFLIFSLPEAQRLYAVDEGVHGLAVRLKDALDSDPVKQRLNSTLKPPLTTITWIDQNRTLVQQVAVERRVMFFILLFIMVVAAFGLMSTLITVTVQKTREIGLLKALGARDIQIATIFTLYGFVVGVAGSVLGVGAGLAMVAYRNEFSRWISATFRIDVFPAEIYHFLQIPAVLDGSTVVVIALCGIVLSTLAALVPALAAARIDPAQSLHNP